MASQIQSMAKAYQTFPAVAFHPDLGNDALEGAIFFSALALTFQSAEQTLEIPAPRLLVRFEDIGDGRIVFQDSLQSDWTIATCDLAVLEHTSIPAIAQLRDELSSRMTRSEVTRRIKQVVWFCAGCALLLWLGMVATGAMVRSVANRVSPEAESKHGEALLQELKASFDFVEETNAITRLRSLAEPLLRAGPSGINWDFTIVKEDSPNAFAIPGGHIIVTQGLLDLAEGPEEILGPVAHEMAHVTRKHSFRQQAASIGPLLVLQLFLKGQNGMVTTVVGAG